MDQTDQERLRKLLALGWKSDSTPAETVALLLKGRKSHYNNLRVEEVLRVVENAEDIPSEALQQIRPESSTCGDTNRWIAWTPVLWDLALVHPEHFNAALVENHFREWLSTPVNCWYIMAQDTVIHSLASTHKEVVLRLAALIREAVDASAHTPDQASRALYAMHMLHPLDDVRPFADSLCLALTKSTHSVSLEAKTIIDAKLDVATLRFHLAEMGIENLDANNRVSSITDFLCHTARRPVDGK